MSNSKLEEKINTLKGKWEEVKGKIENSKRNSEALYSYTETLSKSYEGDVKILINLKDLITKLSNELESMTNQMNTIDVGDKKLSDARTFLETIKKYKDEVESLNKSISS